MNRALWPQPADEVAYFRDQNGTWFAAEVMRQHRWTSRLLAAPDELVADIRIAFLDEPTVPAHAARPDGLAVLCSIDEAEPARVVEAAIAAWAASPRHRGTGETPEAYVVAGFQALCPPHPPCEPGPGSRESLMRYLRERPGILGRLGEQGRDSFNRMLRLFWKTPEDFAESILRERMRDEGASHLLELLSYLEGAAIAPEAEECGELAYQRVALLRRLAPLRFFTDSADVDRAAVEACTWVEEYQRAYAAHFRTVLRALDHTLSEVRPALAASSELAALNREGRAVGDEALRRLASMVTEMRSISRSPEPGLPVTDGVMLGRMPSAIGEARLAGAAVLAALDVQRRRVSPSQAARWR